MGDSRGYIAGVQVKEGEVDSERVKCLIVNGKPGPALCYATDPMIVKDDGNLDPTDSLLTAMLEEIGLPLEKTLIVIESYGQPLSYRRTAVYGYW